MGLKLRVYLLALPFKWRKVLESNATGYIIPTFSVSNFTWLENIEGLPSQIEH